MNPDNHKDINEILNKIFKPDSQANYYNFNELFERKLEFLDITKHQALKILDVDHKVLDSILVGDMKKIDPVILLKLSEFLNVTIEELTSKYFKTVEDSQKASLDLTRRRNFIANNFDLASLKRIGLINSINDFDEIEQNVNNFFGYTNIFEHAKYKINAAFSKSKRVSNPKNLHYWYALACQSLEKTPNHNEFNREDLIAFFPQIRWHSLNTDSGLTMVAQALFKFGITLIVIPKLHKDIHVRGATISFRDKPCIILTKYTEFYATLWFTLVHELYHVLYDWDVINLHRVHLSGATESLKINEEAADNFAREFLFSKTKMTQIIDKINDKTYVKLFAEQNHVHPSIIYTFYCWDHSNEDKEIYSKYNKFMVVDTSKIENDFNYVQIESLCPIPEVSKNRNMQLFNI